MNVANNEEKVVIIYDTFCGWCYGAAPVFDALIESGTQVDVLHAHLFDEHNALKMSDGKGAQILNVVPRIESLTGQIFSDAFKERIALSETEVLQSGLSAQAAALVHGQGAEKEFSMRRRLESLHFGEGVSSMDRTAFVKAAIEEGIAPEDAEKLGTPELVAEAKKQSIQARKLMAAVGSHGVPTVVKVKDGNITQIDHQALYGQPEKLADYLNEI